MRNCVTTICLVFLSFIVTAQAPAALKNFNVIRQMTNDYFVFIRNNKIGLVNKTGKVVLPESYSDVVLTRFNLFVVEKDGLKGVVDLKNKIVLPIEFDRIFILSPQRMHVQKNYTSFVVSSSNRLLADTTEPPPFIVQQDGGMFTPPMIMQDEYAYPSPEDNVFRKDDGVYLINGNDTLKTKYEDIQPLEMDGHFVRFMKNRLWGIMDATGKEMVAAVYTEIHKDYTSDLIIASMNGVNTLLDKQLKPIDAGPFNEVFPANQDGFAIVMYNSNVGLINSSGEVVIKPMLGVIQEYGDHHFSINDGSWKTDIVDKDLKSILPPGTSAQAYSGNIILLSTQDKKMGAMHASGYQLLRPIYDEVFFGNKDDEPFTIFKVRKGNKWGLMNFEEKQIAPFVYDDISSFSKGLSPAVLNGKAGVITEKNTVAVPFIYDKTDYYYNDFNLLQVIKDKKYGFINTKGKVIIPLQYDYAEDDFEGGLSMARKNGKLGFLDTTGKEVVPFEYDDGVQFYYAEKTKVKKGDKWYEIDRHGKILGEAKNPRD